MYAQAIVPTYPPSHHHFTSSPPKYEKHKVVFAGILYNFFHKQYTRLKCVWNQRDSLLFFLPYAHSGFIRVVYQCFFIVFSPKALCGFYGCFITEESFRISPPKQWRGFNGFLNGLIKQFTETNRLSTIGVFISWRQ